MKSPRRTLLAFIAAAVLTGSTLAPRAEVSNDRQANDVPTTMIMAIVEGSDPIGADAWQPLRPLPSAWILNDSGYTRGDGRPDLAFHPGTQWPVVVWAYNNPGLDHDVALSRWIGNGWSAPIFLTSGLVDDLDPRVFVRADGTIDVVWWADGAPDRIFLSTQNPADESFGPASQVTETNNEGRRPSVVFYDGAVWVAYERTANHLDLTQEIVVVRRDGALAGFVTELTVPTPRAGRLDPILHVSRGRMWLDWRHGDDQMGHTVYGPDGWQAVEVDPVDDVSWVGVEAARKVVRRQAMNDDTANISPDD